MSDVGFDCGTGSSIPRWTPAAGVGISIASIWLAVLLASVFSPDMVHGSEQQHLPIAALTDWFWGSVATAFVLISIAIGRVRSFEDKHEAWFLLALTTTAVWVAVTVVSIFAPRLVTGTDPTKIPLAAMISPVVGTVATGFISGAAALLSAGGRPPSQEGGR
jgi:hypothetical protein